MSVPRAQIAEWLGALSNLPTMDIRDAVERNLREQGMDGGDIARILDDLDSYAEYRPKEV